MTIALRRRHNAERDAIEAERSARASAPVPQVRVVTRPDGTQGVELVEDARVAETATRDGAIDEPVSRESE